MFAGVGGGWGEGGVLPELGASPGAGGGEVEADGTGCAVGWKDFLQSVTECGEGFAEGGEAGEDDHSG